MSRLNRLAVRASARGTFMDEQRRYADAAQQHLRATRLHNRNAERWMRVAIWAAGISFALQALAVVLRIVAVKS